jgi:hypothetical protein
MLSDVEIVIPTSAEEAVPILMFIPVSGAKDTSAKSPLYTVLGI